MGTISDKALKKVAGPAWDPIRSQFHSITKTLLSVSPESFAELTTIYIKFTVTNAASSPVYAVIWVKSSKSLDVGIAMPEGVVVEGLGPAPKGMQYKNLTGYFQVEPGQCIPTDLGRWAEQAYSYLKKQL